MPPLCHSVSFSSASFVGPPPATGCLQFAKPIRQICRQSATKWLQHKSTSQWLHLIVQKLRLLCGYILADADTDQYKPPASVLHGGRQHQPATTIDVIIDTFPLPPSLSLSLSLSAKCFISCLLRLLVLQSLAPSFCAAVISSY